MTVNGNSRLEEIKHSSFNLRDAYITDQAEYLAAIRDEALFSNFGIKALIRVPIDEWGEVIDNNVDEYSNFVDVTWMDTTESVIPLFKEYRQNLSEEGMTADGTMGLYALEIIIPTKLHLPRNSRIILSEFNSREEKIAREWTVLGTQMKQMSGSKTYSRVANCVPSRQTTFDSLNSVMLGPIWFDYVIREINKYNLNALGNIWFLGQTIPTGALTKHYITDSIYEKVDEEIIYLESIALKLKYLASTKYIQESSTGFNIGDEVTLYMEESNQNVPVRIAIDEDGTLETMKIKVTNVDSSGHITSYKLSIEGGYSKLSDLDMLNTIAVKDSETFANIKLVSAQEPETDIQEIPTAYDIVGIPKYITPYRMESRFLAKKVAISVLN